MDEQEELSRELRSTMEWKLVTDLLESGRYSAVADAVGFWFCEDDEEYMEFMRLIARRRRRYRDALGGIDG